MEDIVTFNYSDFTKSLTYENIGKKLSKIIELHTPGDSYIFNIKALIGSSATYREKGFYLYLAAKRNYANYVLLGESFLKTGWLDESDLVEAKTNRLLRLTNSEIFFYYEDRNHGY